MNKTTKEFLDFDALSLAEKITGKSYKDDFETATLGMFVHLENSNQKKHYLMENCDTYFSMPFKDYMKVVSDFGFRIIYEEFFTDDEGIKTRNIVMWYKGFLLCFDTFRWIADKEETINGGKVYYNWRIPPDYARESHNHTSSGSFKDELCTLWIGDHDCREGLIFNLTSLMNNGEILEDWIEQPFLWLLHYSQETENYKEVNKRVISEFPKEIQDKINV